MEDGDERYDDFWYSFLSFGPTSGEILAKEADTDLASKELNDLEMDCTQKVKLTLEQQNQPEQIYLRIHKDYSDLIHVYSETGALRVIRNCNIQVLKKYLYVTALLLFGVHGSTLNFGKGRFYIGHT